MKALKWMSAVVLLASVAGAAVAAPWEHAGSKITYDSGSNTTVSRRAYSYAPTGNVPATYTAPATAQAAPIAAAPIHSVPMQSAPVVTSRPSAPVMTAQPVAPQVQLRSTRRYSYQPGMNTPNYRADRKIQFRTGSF
jgi:hypothetical protein